MSTKFFTNREENTLIKKFEGVFTYNPNIQYFDALVGYFRASGYFRIRPFLNQVPNIRILVGINIDKMLADAHKSGLDFFSNYQRTKEDFIREIQKDIAQANYDKDTENGILQFIDDIIQKKIQVKAHPEKKIHAKVYILRPEPFNQHTPATVITGSSNLTDAGLGGGNFYNYEFNVQLTEYPDVQFATAEFEKLWAESVDILPVDIQGIKKETYLNEETSTFELYIKLLTEYFDKNIDYDPDSIGDLPQNFKKLSYQIDAVNEGFNMLLKHNGFILADVVGLGKTVIAAMVAKKFLIQNGRDNTKILVVYPPAVEKNWKDTFKNFNIDKYTKFITNGSLEKILEPHQDYWKKEEYDLVIADEAHKFRNHKTGAFQNLQLICKSPRANQEGLIKGSQKKVILVSATPLNNRPDDIFYQIQMFQDARQSTLPMTNLTAFFSPLMEQYKSLKRFEELDVNKLRDIYGKIRKNVIEPITIRRTRTDLENIAEYKLDLIVQEINFPKVEPPKKVEYIMDEKLNELFHKTVFYLTDKDKLKYSRYQAIAGLNPEIQSKYYENAETASKSLAFIMKTQLIKRLESSFYAFKKSLSNFQKATDRMIEMFANDKIFIAPDTNINKLLDKGWSDEQIEEEIEKLSADNPKNQTFKKADFKPDFIENLENDSRLLQELVKSWDAIENDPKLDVFIEQLNNLFLNKKTNLEGKLVIFSESKDTVNYLAEALQNRGRKNVLVVSSKNRNQLYDTIVTNFDANWAEEKQVNNYSIIITTEVLAEGVNLHRSNVIIHYDTPWNSTKLMQRIGRVNRIGTKANAIYNYVFYPSAQGDSQIQLNKTAFMKIQAFHTAFGEDNQVFSTDEILDEVKLFSGTYKEEQDERLKFLYFLRNFRKNNKTWFDKIKKMPLKSRVGRSSTKINKPDLQNGTAAFLKTDKKFEFYWVDSNNQPREITPIEAFKIFEANQNEKNAELIPSHHDHVNNAIKHFETLEYELVQAQTDPEALGGVAQSAKKWLSGMINHPKLTEKQRDNIKKIINLIDIGKYTNLPSEIDKLQKKKVNLDTAILEIDQIAQKYSIDFSDAQKGQKRKVEKPVLIISESFE
ncbi:phospholipase D-like domain-containing protein [Planktothrix agardhii 1806]|uniref:helicase-related protein n=1 Tax=Planktothrix agardhii TaxID=1160 RepID=UPI001F2ECDAA|nr:helicase-related protein [Planktothrix agardhii]MCF3569733.1 phospholipase D-like domain-containing protein [Planktothrix agardhii 1805]MCF3571835.1 phospholipase D-like domain-containing protein [Planktothrix agardhii 1805]MCF3585271.1 phospholipase D-like domain-containing protein [Planktothrix agardhii 1803]MCF3601951.1 phospholipase D-like domain-containing protein [Planktothrix agardhii 1804]MCF3615010.1 phospholipase D-like domain-containing protein [Planktothrix agardhii 1806]